eukprot:TRINITY_DN47641_c0_g1_i1.p1 TRINITY_DN47641_c0_g1~~TRINITY_DN47641_c0_g1_i1.p1  ORF type:complete len:474 (+),score=84.55 TRINITY_DN47641_c0_g1_i1:62-1483(+)
MLRRSWIASAASISGVCLVLALLVGVHGRRRVAARLSTAPHAPASPPPAASRTELKWGVRDRSPTPPPVRNLSQYRTGPRPTGMAVTASAQPGFLNVTPLCFAGGVGWVWAGEGESPGAVSVQEIRRALTPEPLPSAAGGSCFWDIEPAVLYGPIAESHTPPFHFVFSFVSFALARLSLGRNANAAAYAGYAPTRGGDSELAGVTALTVSPLFSAVHPAGLARTAHFASGAHVLCHPWGLVGVADIYRQLNRVLIECHRGRGRRKCLKKPDLSSAWPELRPLHAAIRRAVAPPMPAVRNATRALFIRRQGPRSVHNMHALAGQWRADGVDTEEVDLVDVGVAAQLGLITAADVVVAMHGSALAWALLVPRKVWVELVPGGQNHPAAAPASSDFIGVNTGKGASYQRYIAMTEGHQIGWVSPLTHSHCRGSEHWKYCGMTVPRHVSERALLVSRALVGGRQVCDGGARRCIVRT